MRSARTASTVVSLALSTLEPKAARQSWLAVGWSTLATGRGTGVPVSTAASDAPRATKATAPKTRTTALRYITIRTVPLRGSLGSGGVASQSASRSELTADLWRSLSRHRREPVAWTCAIGLGRSDPCQEQGQFKDGLWRSLVSALGWGSRGRGFKSRQPDHALAGEGALRCLTGGQRGATSWSQPSLSA